MKRSLAETILGAACIAILAGCATQGDLNSVDSRLAGVENRLARLDSDTRQQLEDLRSSSSTQGQELRTQSAQMYASLQQLREENQALNGRIEELSHSLQTGGQAGPAPQKEVIAQLDALEFRVRQNTERIQRMAQYLNLDLPEAAPPPAQTAPKPSEPTQIVPPPQGEEAMYDAAKQAFDQNDYAGARRGFETFLATYPDSGNADNAQFWIGETYYREKWYEKAILEYQKVIEKYPKGNKVAAALLKQGFSFYNIGDQANARLILKELISKYPQSSEAEQADKKLKGF